MASLRIIIRIVVHQIIVHSTNNGEMMRKYDGRIMLEGVCHDALRLLSNGDTRGAYKLLRHKLKEIDNIEASDYARMEW